MANGKRGKRRRRNRAHKRTRRQKATLPPIPDVQVIGEPLEEIPMAIESDVVVLNEDAMPAPKGTFTVTDVPLFASNSQRLTMQQLWDWKNARRPVRLGIPRPPKPA